MRRFTSILILLTCLALLPAVPASALFFDDTLVSIDGESYTVEDFKHWWKFWQEADTPLPKTPDFYIDWLLLSKEAERMELANDPGFKRQTRIFLQSRTLLMLKYEEVDSQINITDADVRKHYEEIFLPRWVVQRLDFKDETAAAAALQEVSAGALTLDDLLERSPEQGGPASTSEIRMRANRVDPGWVAIFQKMSVGEVVDPSELGKGQSLFFLKERLGGDEEDFSGFSESIRKDLWKKQEDVLTKALLDELIIKYQVEVDEERLAALDINGAEDTFTDAAVITTSRENVSEKQFMAVIRKLMKSRPTAGHAASDEEVARELKAETSYNIIAQSVTNWESLDRHYEEKEPFKWEYQFNYNHRLVQALERRIFVPEVNITEEEIKQHYEENIDRYSQPTVVKLYIIDETQGPVDQIWADVAVGKNFKEVLTEQFGKSGNPQEVPANHLDPEVKAVVGNLIDGETSQIFKAQGIQVIVHLVERIPGTPIPLERVKTSIRSRLSSEKLKQLRSTYVDALKSRSEIEVRMRQWKAIQKELGGA